MYWVSDDGQTYIVAGRYYVHVFCKRNMEWAVLENSKPVPKNIADRRREKLKDKKKDKKAVKH